MEPAVGVGAPHGNAIISKVEATVKSGFAGCVQFKVTDVVVGVTAVTAVGILQAGAGLQVTLLAQPAAVVVPFEVNTNVKHPLAEEEVYAGGKTVPDNVASNGAVASLPSYTFKRSTPFSVLNAVKVTVTKSPGFTGQIVVVILALLP
jgi:hypothetical protein